MFEMILSVLIPTPCQTKQVETKNVYENKKSVSIPHFPFIEWYPTKPVAHQRTEAGCVLVKMQKLYLYVQFFLKENFHSNPVATKW